MSINFVSSNDSHETCNLRTKSNKTKIMMGNETDEIIDELLEYFSQNYQKDLEESIRGGEFNLDSVNLLYYHLQKISLERGGSYIDSPRRLKNGKATMNPENNDDNCFQYALTVTLNYQNIKNNPERTSKIKPFIDQYNWKEKDFPSHSKDWKKFEQNNKSIALMYLIILKK